MAMIYGYFYFYLQIIVVVMQAFDILVSNGKVFMALRSPFCLIHLPNGRPWLSYETDYGSLIADYGSLMTDYYFGCYL